MSHTMRRKVLEKKLLNPYSAFYYKTGLKKLNDDIDEYENEVHKENEDEHFEPFMRRGARMSNNFAIFNNEVYANFPEIKGKTFDIFTKICQVYQEDCKMGKKFSTDSPKLKQERDEQRRMLIKNWGGVEYSAFTSKNKRGNVIRVGKRLANPTHLLKVRGCY